MRGAGLLAIASLLMTVLTTYAVLIGAAFSGKIVTVWLLLPLFFLIGSIGLFARRKWALYFVIPAGLVLYSRYITNGWRINLFSTTNGFVANLIDPTTAASTKILTILIIVTPLAIVGYMIANYKNLK